MISGLPELTFSIVFIGSTRDSHGEARFPLPPNVRHLQCIYLWESSEVDGHRPKPASGRQVEAVRRLHDGFRHPESAVDSSREEQLLKDLATHHKAWTEEFYFGEKSWEYICERYEAFGQGRESFTDYFWTVRKIHAPLLKLARAVPTIPPTRTLHAISNGYAGFFGVLLRQHLRCPFILTEHGLYSKERKIDLLGSYLQKHRDYLVDPEPTGMKPHQALLVRHFETLCRFVYTQADPVLSCAQGNRNRQVEAGVHPERALTIPNGIRIQDFVPLRDRRPAKIPMVLGLLGRIVSIKDIKTFIRAVRILSCRIPEVEGWLIGPETEEPQYAEECRQLANTLGIEQKVRFLGFQNREDILPQLGLLVLTSISEAFPLVILEAYAAGLPVLTTDVGACREIVEGADDEDRALGPAGLVVPIADPEATAAAAHALLADESRWRAAQRAAVERVERYYSEERFLDAYRRVYAEALAKPA